MGEFKPRPIEEVLKHANFASKGATLATKEDLSAWQKEITALREQVRKLKHYEDQAGTIKSQAELMLKFRQERDELKDAYQELARKILEMFPVYTTYVDSMQALDVIKETHLSRVAELEEVVEKVRGLADHLLEKMPEMHYEMGDANFARAMALEYCADKLKELLPAPTDMSGDKIPDTTSTKANDTNGLTPDKKKDKKKEGDDG